MEFTQVQLVPSVSRLTDCASRMTFGQKIEDWDSFVFKFAYPRFTNKCPNAGVSDFHQGRGHIREIVTLERLVVTVVCDTVYFGIDSESFR